MSRRVRARIYWYESGAIEQETHFDERGRMHGVEREGFENGRTKYLAKWVHGRQHGWQRQWDERGRLLVETRFVHGTGLDLWCGDSSGAITESREYVDGMRHGYERWYAGGSGRVFEEGRYVGGVEHGIFRQWTASGRLARGFPRYYVQSRKVTRRQYMRAASGDPSLPPWRACDDTPKRPRPRRRVKAPHGA